MIYQIKNGQMEVRIKSKGAELTSIHSSTENLEYLWQGDPVWWSGQSTVLFPIIGGLPGNGYQYEGKTWNLDPHGFARKSEFDVVEQSEEKLVLHMKESKESLEQYPFMFDLLVHHELKNNVLVQGMSVMNRGDQVMPFSLGAHPGFNCPLLPGELMDDYWIEFEQKETLERRLKAAGMLTGETVPFLNNANIKPLSHSIFKNDAVILKNFHSNWLEIHNKKNKHVIRVEFPGFTDLGIWSAANDGPFVCIEPWFGVDSTHGDSQELMKKEGLIWLDPGKTFDCSYKMIFT